MKVAVVGATGMVGEIMLKVLAERNFPATELLLVASQRSIGKTLSYKNTEHTIIGLADAVAQKPQIAIFSAGGDTSLEWAPKFTEVGTTVIDNSSAWRMDPDIDNFGQNHSKSKLFHHTIGYGFGSFT
jgi:aspartate-semialdehyde dehydrogenase